MAEVKEELSFVDSVVAVDDLVLSNGRLIEQDVAEKVIDEPIVGHGSGLGAGVAGPANDRVAILASYWLNNLHNFEGIALAEEINKAIKKNGLDEDMEAASALMASYPNARRFGLKVVSEEQYLMDPWKRANEAEPRSLRDGLFVRDKDGAYRPATGGLAVLVDKGDSLVLKSKDADGYRAAMELAIAKGWTAIELKGKPAVMAEAWLEAKLKGLDVVNFSPSEKDLAKYAERLAEERVKSGKDVPMAPSQSQEMGLEQVEIRLFVNPDGENKVAQTIYRVSHSVDQEDFYDNPQDAARAFAALPATKLPAVVRSVTRADGFVEEDVTVAGTEVMPGNQKNRKSASGVLDHEFMEAFQEVQNRDKAQDSLDGGGKIVTTGIYSGKILEVKNGVVTQTTGRDGVTVKHDVSKLSRAPKVGDVEDISYVAGMGRVKDRGLAKEGGREIG